MRVEFYSRWIGRSLLCMLSCEWVSAGGVRASVVGGERFDWADLSQNRKFEKGGKG